MAAAEMEGFDDSMSPRAYRRMLMTASIWSLFNKKDRIPHPTSAPVRSPECHVPAEDKQEEGDESSDQPSGTAITQINQDPFAGGIEGGIEYKTMVWWSVTPNNCASASDICRHAGIVMVAETISLGILSLPMALATLGIIPGLVLLLSLGAMASYSGYVIGQFRIAFPHIHSWADAGEVLFGKFGREILGIFQLLFFIFIMGSHILTFSVMMNAVTDHGTCSAVFTIVATIISFIFTLPRTLKNLSYFSIVSFVSIIAAVLITMIDVGINRPGAYLDSNANRIQHIRFWPQSDTSFHSAFLATTNMVFAYAGHATFFSFISEMKDPKDFPKALAFLQISDVSMYIITAVVIYYYSGDNVASPAIDSSSPLVRKIAYGVAIPTITIAGAVNGHVAVKYLYVRIFRNRRDDVLHQKTFKAIGVWAALCCGLWSIAWVIAEGIPVFNDLLGVTSALFASWFTFGLSSVFWVRLNFKREKWQWERLDWSWKTGGFLVKAMANCINFIAALVICVVGLYASIVAIRAVQNKPFSC